MAAQTEHATQGEVCLRCPLLMARDMKKGGHFARPPSCQPIPEKLASGQLGLSSRAFHRVLKLARTIADLAGRVITRLLNEGGAPSWSR